MEALEYLKELHQDRPTLKEVKKGVIDGSDRYVYVGPQLEDGGMPLTYMRRVSDLSKFEAELEEPGENVFYSLNAFWKPRRRSEDIRHLRALYVDIDCYSVGKNPMEVLNELETNYIGNRIPDPNAITFTGRGLNCVWFIENAPKGALETWRRVGAYLLDTLRDFGADPKCSTDPTRVFRLPGSINPKSGKQVKLKLRHENKYALRDLHALYTPWEQATNKKVVHYKRKGYANAVKKNRFTWASLNTARLQDIRTLQNLRNSQRILEGYRETAVMWFHYFATCSSGSEIEAEEATRYFNSQFLQPISEKQLKGIMNYSYGHGKTWAESFANHQLYKVKPKTVVYGSGLLASNKRLIEMLNITPEEQKQMVTIIGEEEYKRRERIRATNNRRKNGQVERKEYLQEQQQATEDKLSQLKELLEANSKAKKTVLADQLGVSRQHLYRLLKQI